MGDDGKQVPPPGDSHEQPEQHSNSHDANDHDTGATEREREARETMRAICASHGDLGTRVRKVLDHATVLWNETGQNENEAAPASHLSPAEVVRARALARRWKTIDFLVDPDLSEGMSPIAVREAAVWRIDIRERGESRWLDEASEPYRGDAVTNLSPVLPVWEYHYPTPEIEAGERRERLADSGMVGACLRCNGTGHRPCAHCEGRGFVECPTCHGRARVMCGRCRGRGQIADAQAERRARASKSYFQVHAERLASDAAGRLADLSERLRQEHGVPLPPSADWLPVAPASGETQPCPECVDGKVTCSCGNGKLVCEVCRGSSHATCRSCGGSGRVVRYREIARRFDTRRSTRIVPPADTAIGKHLSAVSASALRRAPGDEIWEGDVESLSSSTPEHVPADVWHAAQELARAHFAQPEPNAAGTSAAKDEPKGERRVIGRRASLTRVPLTLVEYTFATHPYAFLAVGRAGSERFWADTFPPRWSRVHRFLKALARDLDDMSADFSTRSLRGPADVAVLDEYRARHRRNGSGNGTGGAPGAQRVRIVEEPEEPEVKPEAPAGEASD